MADAIQRPTRGEDMLMLQRKFGYSQRDMMWILGLNPVSYRNAVAGSNGRQPLQMPVAMVIRLLREHPEFSPIPSEPTAQAFYAFCHKLDPEFTPATFAILMGRAETSAYRWLKSSTPAMTKGARRWMLVMWRALSAAANRVERKARLDAFFEAMLDEATARGYDRSVLKHAHQWHLSGAPKAPKLPSAFGNASEGERMVSVPTKRIKARTATPAQESRRAPSRKRK